ncbi:DUF2478 domain-containing protein [Pararhodobacter oceanensis]|uniref:DUF2478 domain-containing protein n=1 Tax=Pararhodobacter oceanensis TaxID=2172121 RepID=UPI003A8D2D19
MKIAYTMAPGRGDTDRLLFRVAEALVAKGYRACGTVQINTEREVNDPCDMDVKVLPQGTVLRISQDLGPHARGCRLDADALETAVGLVAATLNEGADFVIINKFGKHEAEGRGFRDVIAEALALEIPVLVGTNGLNVDAFQEFTDGYAQEIAPEFDSIEAWLTAMIKANQDAA